MAEGRTYLVESEDSEADYVPFQFQSGVGRGLTKQTLGTRTPGRSDTILASPQFTSTRNVDRDIPTQAGQSADLSLLITQLADKIGESITAKLQSDRSTHSLNSTTDSVVRTPDMSIPNVSLVMHSDVKEPPIFRGDGSDKFSVREWEKLMSLYLQKRKVPVQEQSQEILAKLMGKAGDVVRIKLRNDSSLDHDAKPSVIFDILKQHFSDLIYSSMPLADFYNTLPTPGEDAMEYWIRLNKTVDVANECLERQGRRIDDPSHEVSMMFVKHCPDQSLANVFKFKSAEKWTACEIQGRLDEHLQERKSRAASIRLSTFDTSVRKVQSQSHVPKLDGASNADALKAQTQSLPFSSSTAVGVDVDCMRSLVSVLDRLITQQTQIPASLHTQSTLSQPSNKLCRVCRLADHSTLSHCKRENRCLKCLSPGHWKKDCPVRGNQHRSKPSTTPQDQQLN
ncbi:uncharacterized protein LOC106519938 [Austrofundulus limnaeus]|uniref:Uncharacterized protein LOC106519938 n=1 Tax=Austrofundulus limnaeus TaxID=52670 RepID=A0A2I4BHQ2_AUSLI|nr:PREDICTED: uncharacterized protein LOC106519938 [Austrofundulus limnaeus]